MANRSAKKILLAEDEEFTRTLLTDSLKNYGMEVTSVGTVTEALSIIDKVDPHAVLADLNFGFGPDGADLLTKVNEERPWTGMVVMTAHASPELALHGNSRIPENAVYLIKSDIRNIEKLIGAIDESIEKTGKFELPNQNDSGKLQLSATQAEVLRMIAQGLSNASIAKERGITLRAAEALIQRTFSALGIKGDPDVNSRLVAVKMWQQGKVFVK
jgi:DNA-binding NarL/FixJ family response regulator